MTQEDIDEADLSELIDEYYNQEGLRYEGSRGVRDFEKLVKAIDSNYDSLHEFLQDNSGCLEAMVEWIARSRVGEWKENLQNEIIVEDDELDEVTKEFDSTKES